VFENVVLALTVGRRARSGYSVHQVKPGWSKRLRPTVSRARSDVLVLNVHTKQNAAHWKKRRGMQGLTDTEPSGQNAERLWFGGRHSTFL
jgi:hypothetical protein